MNNPSVEFFNLPYPDAPWWNIYLHIYPPKMAQSCTLWLFNIAMGNGPFMPIEIDGKNRT